MASIELYGFLIRYRCHTNIGLSYPCAKVLVSLPKKLTRKFQFYSLMADFTCTLDPLSWSLNIFVADVKVRPSYRAKVLSLLGVPRTRTQKLGFWFIRLLLYLFNSFYLVLLGIQFYRFFTFVLFEKIFNKK